MDIKKMISPPRIRGGNAEDRKATWTELFYDLAFVASIAVLGHELAAHLDIKGLLTFVIIFAGLWWSWVGNTFYNDRFDTDDVIHRVLVYLQMIAIVFIAIFAHDPFGKNFLPFILSFTAIRLLIIQANFTAGYFNKPARPVTYTYALGFSLALIPFFIALFFDSELVRMSLVALGIIISLAVPFLLSNNKISAIPLNLHHLAERFGLFTILILGETIVASVRSGSHIELTGMSMYLIASSVFAAFIFWWLYFEKLDGSVFKKGNIKFGQIWVYTHLFLMMGLVFLAIGLENAVMGLQSIQNGVVFDNAALLNIAWFFVFFCFAIIVYVTTYKGEKKRYESFQSKMYFFSGLVALSFVFLEIHHRPVINLTILNTLGVALIAIDVFVRRKCRKHWDDPLLP